MKNSFYLLLWCGVILWFVGCGGGSNNASNLSSESQKEQKPKQGSQITVSEIGSRGAKVSWNIISDDNQTLDYYEVSYRGDGAKNWRHDGEDGCTRSSRYDEYKCEDVSLQKITNEHIFRNLSSNSSYKFRVRAKYTDETYSDYYYSQVIKTYPSC